MTALALPAAAPAMDALPDAPAPVEEILQGSLAPAGAEARPQAQAVRLDPIVRKINRARRRAGLRRLKAAPSLVRSSRRFGRHLMRRDVFAHAPRIWAKRRWRRVGEVLAMHGGWRARRRQTVRGWMNSPAHRGVLLDRGYRYMGVAAIRGRFGSRRATIWVGQVGR